MEAHQAAAVFAALSQETRVRLLHRLVAAGPGGAVAGELAAVLAVPASTLSFHLAALEKAGLIRGRRQGRQMIYAAAPSGLRSLIGCAAHLCLGDDHASMALVDGLLPPEPATLSASYSVLFLCQRNSARSIMAEAILGQVGGGRFRAFSAGPQPAADPLPAVVQLLRALGHAVGHLRSKSWDEFAGPAGAPMDFVITLCDMPADGAPPPFAGRAIRAAWPLPDPAKFSGSTVERRVLLDELYAGLRRRLVALCRLPLDLLDRAGAQACLDRIGDTRPPAHRA